MSIKTTTIFSRAVGSLLRLGIRARDFAEAYNQYYRVQTLIYFYFPLFVAAKVAHRLLNTDDLEKSMRTAFIGAVILCVALGYRFEQAVFPPNAFSERRRRQSLQEEQGNDRNLKDWENEFGWRSPEALDRLEAALASDTGGLSSEEVTERRKIYGLNKLREPRDWRHVYLVFLTDAHNVLVLAAALASMLCSDWLAFLVLCALLSYNLYGTVLQVKSYEDHARNFEWDYTMSVVVMRDGQLDEINITELVPGDIVHISEEGMVPADIRLISSDGDVIVNIAEISGSPELLSKERGDMCHLSSQIVHGDAFGIVLDTGPRTYLAQFLALSNDPVPKPVALSTPVHISDYNAVVRTSTICLFVSPLVIFTVFAFVAPFRILAADGIAWILMILALTVPTSQISNTSSIRAIGLANITDDGFILHDVFDTELLAGADVIAVDQTGTITENKLVVDEPFCIDCTPEEIMLAACLATGEFENVDALDQTLYGALKRYPEVQGRLQQYYALDRVLFDPETKLAQALIESSTGERMLCVKGAPLYLARHVDEATSEDAMKRYQAGIVESAHEGFRSMGVASRSENGEWKLMGFLRLRDALRYDTRPAIELAGSLELSVKVFTVEAAAMARRLADEVNLGSNIFGRTRERLDEDMGHVDGELLAKVEDTDIFAEADPQHKRMIVDILQEKGHRTVVTGEGYRDVAILRSAYCGIAIEGATDGARSAADMFQFESGGLAPMVRAAQSSREVFQRVHTYLAHSFLVNSGNVFVYALAQAGSSTQSGATMLHLAWVLLLNAHLADIICLITLHDDKPTPFSRSPSRWRPVDFLWSVISSCVVLFAGTLAAGLSKSQLHGHYQSVASFSPASALLCMILTSHWQYILLRTRGRLWLHARPQRGVLIALASIDIVLTLICFSGVLGEGMALDLGQIGRVWCTAILTICASCIVELLIWKEALVDRQLIAGRETTLA